MEEIKVGEYVRTDEGYIAQIKEFKKNYTVGRRINKKEEVDENYINLGKNQCKFVESIDYSIPPCYPTDEELEIIKKHIVKHSPNIIDLIEVGDYVNRKRVSTIQESKDISNNIIIKELWCYFDLHFCSIIRENEIKDIVTKEQFNQIKYEV